MNSRIVIAAVLGSLCARAFAADLTENAPVVSATPIIEKVAEPRRECGTETVQAAAPEESSLAGPVLGGVTGALLGRQVGHGSGNAVATAAGAMAGTMIGDRMANPSSGNRSNTGMLLGGVAGALLGNQVGQGRGNAVATAAGAITGALVGERLANGSAASARAAPRVHCRETYGYREVVKGYNVVYRYGGHDIATILPYNPGKTVTVGVGVVGNQSSGAATRP